ncbi:hypothetical protein GCM10018952_59340 [Streptosporangium vulgare]
MVVDVQGEGGRVQVAVVAHQVAVQEVKRETLLARAGVELALAGGGDRRVHEQQDVLGGDQVRTGLDVSLDRRLRGDVAGSAGEWGHELRIIASKAGPGSRTGVPRPTPEG